MADILSGVAAEAATSILKVVVGRATEEFKLAFGFNNDLDKLLDKLQRLQSILLSTGVENRPSNGGEISHPIQLWLQQVQRVAYDAEDMLELVAFEKVRKKLGKKIRFSRRVRIFFSPSNPILFRPKMAHWVRRINADIDEVYQEAQNLGLKAAKLPAASYNVAEDDVNALQQIREDVDISFVVGREADKAKLVNMLCSSSSHIGDFSVVAIVGLGGIGKTTVAKQVYENEQVKNEFKERIWIHVSEEFNIKRNLNDMVESLDQGIKCDYSSTEITIQKLRNHLDGKRYLVVLDDVWNTNQAIWDVMRSSLQRIGGSSMILLTTRDNKVAETVQADFVHILGSLSKENSWSLFQRIALASISLEEISKFELIGKRIVEKCKGVPLAIRSLGGLLRAKKNADEWLKIERSELWDIPQGSAGVLPSLKLSFNHLPSPFLKKCFSLCATLKRSFILQKGLLIQLWMAHGLLHQSNYSNSTMEDIGEEYFRALLSISFLQVHKRDELSDILTCTMHDLVYDLAVFVGGRECLVYKASNNVPDASGVRHLHLLEPPNNMSDLPQEMVLKYLRSLYVCRNLPETLLSHARYLRILALLDLGLEVVPPSIAGLKYLRVLSLYKNPIKCLPKSVMELYHLQHLNLNNCDKLEGLPGEISTLVNLRHIRVTRFVKVGPGLGQLTCLQTLPLLDLSEDGFQIAELGCLHQIRGKLAIKGLELIKSKQEAEKANISGKQKVDKLELIWCPERAEWLGGLGDDGVLDGLQPNPSLRSLKVAGYRSFRFPRWIRRMAIIDSELNTWRPLDNIIKVELDNCEICLQLPSLGQLPSLKILYIKGMDRLEQIGPAFYNFEDGGVGDSSCSSNSPSPSSSPSSSCKVKKLTEAYFPALKILHLAFLPNLVHWSEPNGEVAAFPSLEELIINGCPQLTTAPKNFNSLKKLDFKGITSGGPLLSIINNSKLNSLKQLCIHEVQELTHLPEELTECTSLQKLLIDYCERLTCLPDGLSRLVSLEVLIVAKCPNLTLLPDLRALTSLLRLYLMENVGLTSTPGGLESCTSLEHLTFRGCRSIQNVPDLSALSRLSLLDICDQTKMICQPPDWLYSLPRLKTLVVGRYLGLDDFPDIGPLLKFNSLEKLVLTGWQMLSLSLPEQLQHFASLKILQISMFDDLVTLPEWLGNLTSLESLQLYRCKNLETLPSLDSLKRLTKLRNLLIIDCPLLAKSLAVNGQKQQKIAHIEVKISTFKDLFGLDPSDNRLLLNI